MKDIDFALVETKRPPMYTAMKYWGKKPHNIWGAYIAHYTQEGDVILDPFSGSAIAAFEAVRCGRKAIAFDINPMTSFLIDVYSTEFSAARMGQAAGRIAAEVAGSPVYRRYMTVRCARCGAPNAEVQHTKWENGHPYEMGVACPACGRRYLAVPDGEMRALALEAEGLEIPFWYPADPFFESPSFSKSFVKNIGGGSFDRLWTKRNLFVLAYIFDRILQQPEQDLQKQLLFGFVQTLHLASKMCVPRRAGANRDFSTSWGRAAYLCSGRQMEMNPLLLFQRSCLGKQSVESALTSVKSHLGRVPSAKRYIPGMDVMAELQAHDILYGVVDIKELDKALPAQSISFVITDPPYGGLVQYLDLSCVWLVWLRQYSPLLSPCLEKEITVKKGQKGLEEYSRDFTRGIQNLHRVLKDDGRAVFTFHNKDLAVWKSFLHSLGQAGFCVENAIHQQNRRTGESNVANPYGTSASDFYIRCIKASGAGQPAPKIGFEAFVVNGAAAIIAARNEPAPYQVLFNGLLAAMSKAGLELDNFDTDIRRILQKHTGDVFETVRSPGRAGDRWWLRDRSLLSPQVPPLSQRVRGAIRGLYQKNDQYTLDEIIGEIFKQYPGDLTPDIRDIEAFVEEYAVRRGEKWVRREGQADGRKV